MRIGIMAPPWLPVPPPGYGGIEAVVDQLARGYQAAGHDVLLWTTGDSTCPVPKGWVIEHAEADRMGAATVELHHVFRGQQAMRAWHADVVHDHTVLGPVVATSLDDLVVVTTNHGRFDAELSDLYRMVAGRIPLIAISHHQASTSPVPVTAVIHHGIDLAVYPFGDGSGDEDGPYHLFLGRMSAQKGVDVAVEAARSAGVRLLLAAKCQLPDEHHYFEDVIRPHLDRNIVDVGEADHARKIELLRHATSLVNPIRWAEPFGLVMIESLACGTPVLTSAEGAAPELVDEGLTGFFCRGTDDLAARLGDVERLDRAACRHVAETRFSTERMVDQHLELFARLLAGKTAA